MTHMAPVLHVTARDNDEARILDRIASNYSRNETIAFLSTDNVSSVGIQFQPQPGDGDGQPPRTTTTTGFTFEDDGEHDYVTPLQRLRLRLYCTLSRQEGGRR